MQGSSSKYSVKGGRPRYPTQQYTSSAKKFTDKIVSDCDSELSDSMCRSSSKGRETFIDSFNLDHFLSTFDLEQECTLWDHLREVNYSEPAVMKVLYQFKMKSRHEYEEIANESKQEHLALMMKTNRLAGLIEKLKAIKKMVGKKKLAEDGMKAFLYQKGLKGNQKDPDDI